jgi:hypothetical protein
MEVVPGEDDFGYNERIVKKTLGKDSSFARGSKAKKIVRDFLGADSLSKFDKQEGKEGGSK